MISIYFVGCTFKWFQFKGNLVGFCELDRRMYGVMVRHVTLLLRFTGHTTYQLHNYNHLLTNNRDKNNNRDNQFKPTEISIVKI